MAASLDKNNKGVASRILATAKSNPIVVLLVLVSIVVGFTTQNFFSWGNLGNLISNTAIRFLIALGVSGCLITKGTATKPSSSKELMTSAPS